MEPKDFVFKLGDKVKLSLTDEKGIVIARSQHAHGENQYRLRYKATDGRQVEDWWAETAIVATAD